MENEQVQEKSKILVDGTLSVRGAEAEAEIVCLYYSIVEFGLDKVIWYQKIPSLSEFFDWLESGNNNLVLLFDESKMVGAGFINEVKYQADDKYRCEVGFVTFPGLSPFKAVKLGKMAFNLTMSELKYDYYYGTTPACNPKAIKYAELLGMKPISRIPNLVSYNGKTDDAVISYISKDSYPLK